MSKVSWHGAISYRISASILEDLPSNYTAVRLLLLVERLGTLEFEASMRLPTLAPIVPVNNISYSGPQTRESPIAINMATIPGKGQFSLTNPMANPYHLWENVQGPITCFRAGDSDTRKRLSACRQSNIFGHADNPFPIRTPLFLKTSC